MIKGDIILASLPQSDGSQKRRPALVINLFPPYDDCLVCGISSRLHQHHEKNSYLISKESSFFSDTGLNKTSVVRFNFLAMIPQYMIIGKIGVLQQDIYNEILNKLIQLIKK